jgi:hypothetical protein
MFGSYKGLVRKKAEKLTRDANDPMAVPRGKLQVPAANGIKV